MENQQPFVSPGQPTVNIIKKHTVRKVLTIIAVALVILAIVVLNIPRILNLIAKDIPPIDDSDIRIQKIEIAESDNGFFDLAKLDKVIYYPTDKSKLMTDITDGKTWDEDFVAELISKNTEAFKYFSDAATKPKIQYPEEMDPKNISPKISLLHLNTWRYMAKIDSIYALYLAKKGKSKLAMEEAMKNVEIGQKMENSQLMLIEYIVAVAIKDLGLKTIQQITATSNLGSKELKGYTDQLNQYFDSETGMISAFKGEYLSQVWTLDLFRQISKQDPKNRDDLFVKAFDASDKNDELNDSDLTISEFAKKMGSSYYYEPNKTQLLYADNTRSVIQNAKVSCGQTPTTPIKLVASMNPVTMFFDENHIGKVLHDIVASSLDSLNVKKCEERVLTGATQLILAIKAYKNDTKKYPTSLDDLVPTYISLVPIDPFDHMPLKYSSSDRTIYSAHASSTFSIKF